MIDCRFILLCVSPWLLRLLGLTFMSSWTLGVFLLQWHAWEAVFGYSRHLLLKRHVSFFFCLFALGWVLGLWLLSTCVFVWCAEEKSDFVDGRITVSGCLYWTLDRFGYSNRSKVCVVLCCDQWIVWGFVWSIQYALWPLVGLKLNY